MPTGTEKPFAAYSGDDAYFFVCYSHADSATVYGELTRLAGLGANLWYDEGIEPGSEWSESLAGAIAGAERLLFFVSPRSVESHHCRNEIRYALDNDIPIVCIHLEATELSEGLKLSLSSMQAILRYDLPETLYVQKLASLLDAASPTVAQPARQQPSLPGRLTPPRVIAAVAAVIVAIAIATWYAGSGHVALPDDPVVADTAGPRPIAVLPFVNLSNDTDNEFFADGLTDTLIHRLSQLEALRVTARTSVFPFKNSQLDMATIASQLGVALVLDGSVQRAGSRIRVFARLTEVDTGRNIWSEQFDAEAEDVFGVHDDVAASVAGALEIELLGGSRTALSRHPTESLEAYEAYLRGLEYFEQVNFESMDVSVREFERALALDPDFALAHVMLAHNYITQFISGKIGLATLRERAEPLTRRAIELDPDLAEAYTVRGLITGFTQFPRLGRRDLEKALAANPNSAITAAHLGGLLAFAGEPQRAMELAMTARTLDPVGVWPRFDFLFAAQSAGNFTSAFDVLSLSKTSWDPFFLGLYHWQVDGDRATALEQFERGQAIDPRDPEMAAYLAMISMDLGREADARRWQAAAVAANPDHMLAAASAALFEVRYGEPGRAAEIAADVLPKRGQLRFEAPPVLLRILRDRHLDAGEAELALAWYDSILPQLSGNDFEGRWPVFTPAMVMQAALDRSYVLYKVGRRDEAEAAWTAIAAELAAAPRIGLFGYGMADVQLAALSGDRAGAIRGMRELVESPWNSLWWFHLGNRNLDGVRDDSDFAELARALEHRIREQP